MVLAMTVCEICPPGEVEMMISVLLNIFDTRASLLSLIKLMIDREVAQTGMLQDAYSIGIPSWPAIYQKMNPGYSEVTQRAHAFYQRLQGCMGINIFATW